MRNVKIYCLISPRTFTYMTRWQIWRYCARLRCTGCWDDIWYVVRFMSASRDSRSCSFHLCNNYRSFSPWGTRNPVCSQSQFVRSTVHDWWCWLSEENGIKPPLTYRSSNFMKTLNLFRKWPCMYFSIVKDFLWGGYESSTSVNPVIGIWSGLSFSDPSNSEEKKLTFPGMRDVRTFREQLQLSSWETVSLSIHLQ